MSFPLHAATPTELHVAKTGDDANPGTADAPLATLAGARGAIRKLKAGSGLPEGGVTVWIHAGNYEIEKTFGLREQDSGTENAPIVYRAADSEHVSINCGKSVTGWQPLSDEAILARLDASARNQVQVADLAELGISNLGELSPRGYQFSMAPAPLELFHDDQPMTVARWPNSGWQTVLGSAKQNGTVGFAVPESRAARWKDEPNLLVHGFWSSDTADQLLPVQAVNEQANSLFVAPEFAQEKYEPGTRFRVVNVLTELDAPGEYYVDRAAGRLYFLPPSNSTAESEYRVSVGNTPICLVNASYITLQGLTIEQARVCGVEVIGGSHVAIVNCTIRNIGNVGINLNGGEHHRVISTLVTHTGDGGVRVDGGDVKTLSPAGHVIENCEIANFARVGQAYRPAINVYGVGTTVRHNRIHHGPHMGILLNGNEHLVEANDLFALCQETSEAGAVQLGHDWTQRGNVVRQNYFHDLGGPDSRDIAGVYLDDFGSGTTITENVFSQMNYAVVISGGRDNLVADNFISRCQAAVQLEAPGLDRQQECLKADSPLMNRVAEICSPGSVCAQHYPTLSKLVSDQPELPKGNRFLRNAVENGPWVELVGKADAALLQTDADQDSGEPQFVEAKSSTQNQELQSSAGPQG